MAATDGDSRYDQGQAHPKGSSLQDLNNARDGTFGALTLSRKIPLMKQSLPPAAVRPLI